MRNQAICVTIASCYKYPFDKYCPHSRFPYHWCSLMVHIDRLESGWCSKSTSIGDNAVENKICLKSVRPATSVHVVASVCLMVSVSMEQAVRVQCVYCEKTVGDQNFSLTLSPINALDQGVCHDVPTWFQIVIHLAQKMCYQGNDGATEINFTTDKKPSSSRGTLRIVTVQTTTLAKRLSQYISGKSGNKK